MQKMLVFEKRLHTECFYSGDRSYFIDLIPTKINKLCIRMAIGHDLGSKTKYARIVLFENDLDHFIDAFCGVMHEYMALKNKRV